MLTHSRLCELLEYDPATGLWFNLVARGNRCVGPMESKPLQLCVDGKLYRKSRLAWFYMTGNWPINEIDHVNCDIKDDRWVNLREADRFENCRNRRKRKDSQGLVKGVDWHRQSQKWRARITANGKTIELGRFDCQLAAQTAYIAASTQFHGAFARP